MPKGRRANPSTARDGEWFSLNKKEEQFPESLTATMQKQIFDTEAICKIDKRLPWVYKLRAKEPVNKFPFSVHDNRHGLTDGGDYLLSGQGLKKFQHEKSQHYTNNLVFFTHQPLPSSTSFRSTYQASFVEYPNLESTLLGRFPKNHINRSIALRPADKKECMWFSKFYTRHPNILPVELEAPLPEPKKHLPALQAAE